MRNSLTALVSATCLATLSIDPLAIAQETTPETEPLPEQTEPGLLVPMETDANTLIPDSPTPANAQPEPYYDVEIPAYEELPIPKEEPFIVPENKLGKQQQDRIKFFETRVKAINDPELKEAWALAGKVRTFPERRQIMANYYIGLYALMLKMAPDIQDLILESRDRELAPLRETQIRPSTYPVAPAEFPTPAPSREGAEKEKPKKKDDERERDRW